MANNSTPVSLVQPKTFADANDQFLAWSPASGNDVIVPVQNLFSTVPLVVGTTITVGNSSGVVINTTAVAVNGVVIAAGGGYAGGNLIPTGDATQVIGNTTNRFATLDIANSILVGNSTVGATINTTAFSGQANSTLFVGTLSAANVVSNAQLVANLAQYQPTVTLGAAVAALTANAANFIGSLPAASVANTSAPAFTTSVEVGNVANNVTVVPTSVKVGNSTINATMNSSSFSGTSNNTLFVGATSAANVVSNAQLVANLATYTTTAGLGTAIAGMSVNNAVNLNGLAASNYANTSNATITAVQTVTLTVSNAASFGPNVIINSTAFFAGNSTVFNVSNAVDSVIASPSSNVAANSSTILLGNSIISSSINSTVYTGSSNNTLHVGSLSVANVVSNAQLSANLAGYQTSAGLAANIATLTANNATFLGGLPAADYANNSTPVVGTIEVGTISNNVFINSTSVTVGNSTINATMNSTSYSGTALNANSTAFFGGLPATDYANNSSPTISSNLTVGSVSVNTSAIFVGPSTQVSGNGLTTNTVNVANLIPNILIANGVIGLTGQVLLSGGPGSNVFWGPPPSNATSNVSFGNPNQIAFNANGIETGDANFTWQSSNGLMTVGAIGNSVVTSNHNITFGNSSVFATINSTFYTGSVNNAIVALTANNSLNLGGILAENFANTSNASIANLQVTIATVNAATIGNVTSQATINSTIYSATSNNTLFVGATSAANVVSNAQLTANVALLQTTAGLAANVAKLPANSASFIGTLAAASVANTSAPVFSTSAKVGANVTLSTTSLVIGTTTLDTNQLLVANLIPNIIVANGGVGLAGQVLTTGGPGTNNFWSTVASNGGGSGNGVYGTFNTIAYNNGGTETGDATFTWQSSNVVMTVGSGATSNTVQVFNNAVIVGNSTINTTMNSTSFTGTSANSLNSGSLGGLAAVNYANTSAPLILTSVTVGNSTVNNSINSTSYSGTANDTLFVGATSAANVVSNTQLVSNLAAYTTTAGMSTLVSTLTANNAANLGGVPASGYANTSAPVITTTLEVGAVGNNVTANTTTVKIGNSTIFSTINSTAFSATANDTLFVGATSAANVVSNTQLVSNLALYQLTSGLAAAVAVLPANSASFIGTLAAASVANTSAPVITTSLEVGAGGLANNVTVLPASVTVGNSTINAVMTPTTFSGTANDATNLGGLAAANYANTSNAAVTAAIIGTVALGSNNVIINATAVSVGNSTVNSIHTATTFSGTANNATNLGGLAAASYANTSAPAFTTSAKVGANVVLTTASVSVGNSTVNSAMSATNLVVGGTITANAANNGTSGQVLTSGGAGNVFWSTIASGATGSNTQIPFNNSGVEAGDPNFTWNTVGTILTIGGAITNVQISDTNFSGQSNDSLNLGGIPASSYANTSAPVIANTVQVGTGFSNGTIINSTAVFMGNSSVFGTINTTNYTGTSNNANNLGGLAAINFPNTSVATITTLTTNNFTVGNSTVNTTSNSTTLSVSNVVIATRLTANAGVGTVGQILTSGGGTTNAYWSTFAAGAVGSTTQISFNNAGVQSGDANLTWTPATATLTIGNTTVKTTANSTIFSGTANNATNLGGLAAANYANTSVATFSTSANVGAVSQLSTTTLTTGNSTAQFIANSSVLQVPGQISANGSVGTASFVLTSGGAGANAFWKVASGGGGTPGGLTTQIQFNLAGAFAGDANLSWNTTTGTMTVGNSSVFSTINSTFNQIATVNATSIDTVTLTATGNVSGATVNASANLNVANLATFGNSTVHTTINSTMISTNGTISVANSVLLTNGSVTINNAVVPTMGMIYGMLCGYAMT